MASICSTKVFAISLALLFTGMTMTMGVENDPVGGNSDWAPQIMYYEQDSIVLNGGETLNLTCQDEAKVVWVKPETVQSYTNYEETYDPISNRYIANLVIENVNYTQVGYYYCVHNTTENKNKGQWSPSDANVSSIYVYVKDLPTLLVDAPIYYVAVVNRNFTFPCKPTFPEVEVTLNKYQGNFNSSYDPRNGFFMGYPSLKTHAGDYTCEASYGDHHKIMYLTLSVKSDHKETLTRPTMEANNYWQENTLMEHYGIGYYDVEEGSSVNLTCTYDKISSPMNLTWIFPTNANESSTLKLHRNTNRDLHTRIMGITDANPSRDSGDYTCVILNLASKESMQSTVYINVLPRDYKGVAMAIEEPDMQVSPDETSTTWGVMYNSYPEPTFIWWKGDTVLVNSSKTNSGDKRYKLDIDHTGGILYLEIDEPAINDIGNYTLEGLITDGGKTVASDTKQLTLTMPVAPSTPTIEIYLENTITNQMVPELQDFKLICKGQGYPKPTMILQFKNCYSRNNCTKYETVPLDYDPRNELNLVDEEQTKESFVNKTTVWEGNALMQGYYRCVAKNIHGQREVTSEFLVTDGNHNFLSLEVTVNNKSTDKLQKTVLEADNVTIICRGNKLKTTPPLKWTLNGYIFNQNNISRTSKMIITEADTEVSYVSMISIEKITKEKKQLSFVCEDSQVSSLRTNHNIFIKPMISPTWLTRSDPLQDHNLKERGNLTLSCPANGVPTPEIRWYKDDVLLRDKDTVDRKHRIISGSDIKFGYLMMSDSGVYKCEAHNRNGIIKSVATITVTDPDAYVNIIVIVVVVTLTCCLILTSIFSCRKIIKEKKRANSIRLADQRMFEQGDPENLNPELGLDEQAELLPYDTKYEVTRDSIIFDKLLGAGAFGRVYRAQAVNLIPGQSRTTVAVKMMKSRTDCAQLKALRSEVKIMIHIGRHVNIVNLLGACSKELASKGELLLLVEYCSHGNILDYMRRHRMDFINQINEYDKIDPSLSDPRIRHRSGSGSRSRTSRGIKYAHLSFNQDAVSYTMGRHHGTGVSNQSTWVEHPRTPTTPTTPTFLLNGPNGHLVNGPNGHLMNGPNGHLMNSPNGHHIPETFRSRTMSGSSGHHMASDMSTMTMDSSTGTADGYLDSRVVGPHPVTLCSKELLCWAFQIAKGMEYLAFKKVLHGDLAARNILLTEDNVVKISDFGLAKDIYKSDNYRKKSKTPVPWKWLALECFQDSVFSTQSDVWSFGVVLWEIFTLGQSPYPGVDFDEGFVAKLEKGIRLDQPKYATYDLYRVMMDCWSGVPMERPSFSVLEQKLGEMLGDAERQHYLELNTPYQMENTGSTFVNLLQSPDYSAKVRERSPTMDQDGYEVAITPNPYGAMSLPPIHEPIGSPGFAFPTGQMQNDEIDGRQSSYVPMTSPTRTSSNVFNFDDAAVDYIKKRDSEAQVDVHDINHVDATGKDDYLSMQNTPNSVNTPNLDKSPQPLAFTSPLRHKIGRSASTMEKHDSGLYSPTAHMQSNPHYMVMNSFPNTDENDPQVINNMYGNCNGKTPDYINIDDKYLQSPKYFQKDYIKDAKCDEEFATLFQGDDSRVRTISETSSGVGFISEESPSMCRAPDCFKSPGMEVVQEEPLCV